MHNLHLLVLLIIVVHKQHKKAHVAWFIKQSHLNPIKCCQTPPRVHFPRVNIFN